MAIDLERFPTSPSAKRMIASVSEEFYEKSYVGKWLYQVMGLEMDEARLLIESLPEQVFPETATWGLMYHEMKWGLPVRENLDPEERRRLIYRRRDLRAPMNPWRLEWYLQNYTGYNFHIEDINDAHLYGWVAPHPNTFKVYITDVEGTTDVKAVKARLNELRQSHTTYSLQERVGMVFDHSELEHIEAFRAILRWAIDFWGAPYLLDGSHFLDGSLRLGSNRRYDLIPGIQYRIRGPASTETIVFPIIRLASSIKTREQMGVRPWTRYGMEIDFWRTALLDGAALLDGSLRLDGGRRYDLIPSIVIRARTPASPERVYLPQMQIAGSIENHERMGGGIRNRYHMAADLWGSSLLDGAYFLDGSIRLDGGRRYDLVPGFAYRIVSPRFDETIRVPKTHIQTSIHTTEAMGTRWAMKFGWPVFWNRLFLDGSALLDGSLLLDGAQRGVNPTITVRAALPKAEEKIEKVVLTTSTRDYAFLDGSLAMDGSRRLNSIYRKEEL